MDMRSRLIAAAERLVFERGLDNVSLREITAAAGARNGSAIQYHLKDRNGLIMAILAKHAPEVEARRHALLDQWEADDSDDLRALAGAYVRPLAAKLDDADGGPGFLRLLADLTTRPSEPLLEVVIESGSSERWRAAVAPLMAPGAVELHRRFTAAQFTHVELARRAHDRPGGDHALFTSHLVDLVTGLLSAPVSEETARLVAKRDRRRAAVPPATSP